MLRLNPFLPKERSYLFLKLVTVTLLRANRIGHASRCIGCVVTLLKLLRRAGNESANTLAPKIVQAGEDLAECLVAERYFVTKDSDGLLSYDPRFLLCEFLWNLLLR